jgi:prophage regulatory protein
MTEPLQLDPLPAVLEQNGGGHSSLYDAIAEGLWTPPVKRGRASRWPRHETQALVAAHIAGASEEQLRALVRRLLEQRKALMPQLEPRP